MVRRAMSSYLRKKASKTNCFQRHCIAGYCPWTLDRCRAGQRVAEIVGRNEPLVQRSEVCRPFFFAEIDHDGPILPDIVVVVGVIAIAMDEALGRSLI